MALIVLFHSVYGLRPVELGVAARLRAGGHSVFTPDLYAGMAADTVEDGFALAEQVGWPAITGRARDAIGKLSGDVVLAGISMGASVVEALLPERARIAGVLLWHGLADIPATVRSALPVQAHLADPDQYFPAARVAGWTGAVDAGPAEAELFAYPRVGHFFTDPTLPDYDPSAAALAWERSVGFLGRL
ncbi:MAG TPA: dienelactone hydrolase family protein [Pseudonocardiaceae bacterium]|nr:dienelactone hydrolase family protein [Pseudonocardiaceae bacterium]